MKGGSALAPSVYLSIPRNGLFRKSVFYDGVSLWNIVPNYVRLCYTVDESKREISNLITDKLDYTSTRTISSQNSFFV